MRFVVPALFLLATAVHAEDPKLNFDIPKLCLWQAENNGMDVAECTKLETDSQAAIPALEPKAEVTRVAECKKEALNFSGDSGFASYTVYEGCLKDGPGSL
jgi:hypothetical protein